MLTPKQSKLLLYIHRIQQEYNVSPSYEEMMFELGLKSKSGVFRLIQSLEKHGFVRKFAHRARALEILQLPPNLTPYPSNLSSLKHHDAPLDTLKMRHTTPPTVSSQPVASGSILSGSVLSGMEIPFCGVIAAGTPIDALQVEGETVFVPEGMIGSGDHFALEVSGDSMKDFGILDKDQIIIRRASTARSGDIVIALIDNEVATLKTLKVKIKKYERDTEHETEQNIELHPANSAYDVQSYEPNRVQIQGLLVGLLRKY